jgi:hypothetical protein
LPIRAAIEDDARTDCIAMTTGPGKIHEELCEEFAVSSRYDDEAKRWFSSFCKQRARGRWRAFGKVHKPTLSNGHSGK